MKNRNKKRTTRQEEKKTQKKTALIPTALSAWEHITNFKQPSPNNKWQAEQNALPLQTYARTETETESEGGWGVETETERERERETEREREKQREREQFFWMYGFATRLLICSTLSFSKNSSLVLSLRKRSSNGHFDL